MQTIKALSTIMASLSEPFSENLLQHRQQGGQWITSIAWHTALDRLDNVYPYWSQNVDKIEVIGNSVVVTVSITLQFTDGAVTRSNTGIEALDTSSWGDVVSNATAMAFKRAAVMFGVGRYLYYKESKEHSSSHAQPQAYAATAGATSSSNDVALASDGQKKAIFAISKVLNQSYDRYLGGKKLDQVTKAEAIKIIERMNTEKEKQGLS